MMNESQEDSPQLPKVGDPVRFFAPGRRPVDATIANVWPKDQTGDIDKYSGLILIDLDYHVVYSNIRCLRREFRVPPYGVIARDYGWKPKE